MFQVNPDTSTKEVQPAMVTDRENGPVRAAPGDRGTPAEVALVED